MYSLRTKCFNIVHDQIFSIFFSISIIKSIRIIINCEIDSCIKYLCLLKVNIIHNNWIAITDYDWVWIHLIVMEYKRRTVDLTIIMGRNIVKIQVSWDGFLLLFFFIIFHVIILIVLITFFLICICFFAFFMHIKVLNFIVIIRNRALSSLSIEYEYFSSHLN